jgi:LPXTG-motif cell wall-anchored protein
MVRALGAVALAGAILAGPLGLGQAQAAKVESFSGMGTGYALRVSLDLRPLVNAVPALGTALQTVVGAIPGASMDTPGVIDQFFIRTTSDANGVVNKARSALAEGLIDLDVVEASNVGQVIEKTVQNIQIPSAQLPILQGDVGILRAAVNKATDVDGNGTFNALDVGLPLDAVEGLRDFLASVLALDNAEGLGGLVDQLEGVINGLVGDDLVGGLTQTITDLSDELTGGALGGLAGGLGLPVDALDDPTQVAPQVEELLGGVLDVDSLLDQIVGTLTGSLLSGDLASLTDLVNNTAALQIASDGTAVAKSVASLASLDVLGGLVDVSAFNLSSESRAAGVPGSAKNTSSCSLADVKLGGGDLGLSLDGTNITIGGTKVPVVGDLVGTVKGLVDGILNTLGINVALCDVAQKQADPDGTAAAQRVSALRVEVAPLGLFRLIIDPTVETAVAAQVGQPDVSAQPAPNLPKTGAPIVATVLSGIALAGGALMVRRRFI